MPCVLHLIDGASPQATPAALALIAATVRHVAGFDHQVLLLGGTQLEEDARSAGLARFTRLGTPGQRAALGRFALKRWLAREQGRSVDLVHAWSCESVRTAAALLPAAPRLLSLTLPPDAATSLAAWLRRPWPVPCAVTVLNEAMRADLVAHGVDEACITTLPPAIDTTLFSAAGRDAVRATWNLDSDDACVLALLSDPPTAADARKANLGMGLAHESLRAALGRPPAMRLLMHPDQLNRLSAYRLLVNYGAADLIAQEPRTRAPWQILPGCDAALIPAEHAGGLATAWAMAAGVAIVAETPSPADELLRNEHNALLADRDQPKRLAHRLHQLIHEPSVARRVADEARRGAADRFAPARYAERLATLYRAMIGEDNLARAVTDAWASAEQAAAPGAV